MNFKEAFEKVDKSDSNKVYPCADSFCNVLDVNTYLGWSEELNEALVGYWLCNWLCTDTWVGGILYFFNGKPAAYSWQPARKSNMTISFISKEIAEEIRNFIIDLYKDINGEIPLLDMEEEFDNYYTINYGSQLLSRANAKGTVHGEPVTVVQIYDSYKEIGNWTKLDVSKENDDKIYTVDMSDFHIPLKLNPQNNI